MITPLNVPCHMQVKQWPPITHQNFRHWPSDEHVNHLQLGKHVLQSNRWLMRCTQYAGIQEAFPQPKANVCKLNLRQVINSRPYSQDRPLQKVPSGPAHTQLITAGHHQHAYDYNQPKTQNPTVPLGYTTVQTVMIFGCCGMCRHRQRRRQNVVKAEMSPDNASILVCGGGGIALDVTRKLKDMGAWVWMLQRSDSRRYVHAPALCTSLCTFSLFGSQGISLCIGN